LIIGIGVDIVSNNRIKYLINKYNSRFIERIYTHREINYSKKLNSILQILYFAKRFAAKEAFSKACGIGIGRGLNFNDIEIINDIKGKPLICLNQRKIEYIQNLYNCKKFKIHLSLSDEKENSIANVIIEKLTL
jgi:holo-[acyl-carrier protein] synthase